MTDAQIAAFWSSPWLWFSYLGLALALAGIAGYYLLLWAEIRRDRISLEVARQMIETEDWLPLELYRPEDEEVDRA